MSLNLITKTGGSVTHKNDGAYRRSVTPDGILQGCAMTYSGKTLTIASGYMMICGREVYLSVAEAYTIPTTAAYAYLKYTISESNGTITSSVAASSTASPSAGTQGDINASGTTYGCVIAVMSISGGAITGIANKLRKIAPQGVIYGTAATPSDTDYVDGTRYIQYTE
jgi:hypothetical protein